MTPSERSLSVSVSTPRGDTPSKRSTLDTIYPVPISSSGRGSPRSVTGDLERLADELRQYDHNRAEENRELGDALRNLRDELIGLSESIHHPHPSGEPLQEPLQPGESSPPRHVPQPREPSQRPFYPPYLQPPYPQPPRPYYVEERIGSSHARTDDENRSISLAPSSLNRTPSSASSVSFLSSHHSDDWLLYPTPQPGSPISRRSLRPDSPMPTLPDIDDSEISSESSSSLSTPMLSSSSTSGPYPGSSGPSSSPTSPPSTPTPSSVLSSAPASVQAPSSPAETTSTIRPSPPNPVPLLNEIRDQVRALWDGQLSTNHLLDEIRGRRSEQDENPVLDRIQRVEDLLQALLNRETQPEVIVSDPGPRQPSPTTSSISQSSIDRIINSYPRREAPIAPIPRPPSSGISLARRLEEILSQGAQPSSRPPARPDPLHLFDYAPVHRQYSDSPLSRIRVPLPPRPPSEPIPHMFRHPRETRGRRHVHPQTQTQTHTVDDSLEPSHRPSGPSDPQEMRNMGQRQRPLNTGPPPLPIVRCFLSVPVFFFKREFLLVP